MRPFLLRLASLACGLVLTLPPGWCCLWLPRPAHAAAPADAPAESPCPCCPHPAQPDEPATPAPARPQRCPCADRDATTPEPLKVPAPQAGDGLATAWPAAADLSPSPALAGSLPALSLALTSAPLNLLHCVWLC
jgi:hypothetical protein